jgi:hypothetical protein
MCIISSVANLLAVITTGVWLDHLSKIKSRTGLANGLSGLMLLGSVLVGEFQKHLNLRTFVFRRLLYSYRCSYMPLLGLKFHQVPSSWTNGRKFKFEIDFYQLNTRLTHKFSEKNPLN